MKTIWNQFKKNIKSHSFFSYESPFCDCGIQLSHKTKYMNNSTLEYLECPDCSNKYVSMLDQYGRFVKGAQFTNLLDKNTPETFSEWYRKEYQEEWNKEEHSYDFALKMSNEYAKWCKSVKITPDWR